MTEATDDSAAMPPRLGAPQPAVRVDLPAFIAESILPAGRGPVKGGAQAEKIPGSKIDYWVRLFYLLGLGWSI